MARKEKLYHYIYKTTCIVTKKFYVGMHSTNNLEDGYFGSGRQLRCSIHKYGIENHKKEILEFFCDRISLKLKEADIVNEKFIQDPMCMNLQLGGGGGFSSEEHAYKFHAAGGRKVFQILSKRHLERLKNDPAYLQKFKDSLPHIFGPDNAFYGKHHTAETKERMREKAQQRTGDKSSCWGTCWIFHEDFGNKKIKKENLNDYLKQGWKQGRIQKSS